MSARMTAKKIVETLTIKAQFGIALTPREMAFNHAVVQASKAKPAPNYDGNEEYFWNGRYVQPATDAEWGHNEGVDAVEAYKAGKDMATEKSDDQRKFELRQRCFTMAQQGAPRRMNGMDPEPPKETIQRAMYLEHYFTTGELLDAPVAGKAK